MREDLTSSSFLAVIVLSMSVVCAVFIALGIAIVTTADPCCAK